MINQFNKNTKGQDIIVGDIHGSLALLLKLLRYVNFDPNTDRLFLLGDIINKGINSEGMIDFLNTKGVYCLKGNHELMFEEYLNNIDNGNNNNWLFQGYGWQFHHSKRKQIRFCSKLIHLPIAIELETDLGLVGLVHARVPSACTSWNDFTQNIATLYQQAVWEFGTHTTPSDIDYTFHGHTIRSKVKSVGNSYWLDTGAYRTNTVGVSIFNKDKLSVFTFK